MPSHWLAFWDSPHSIYVNVRHKDVHYRGIAEAIAALVPSPNARVLDYGSGEALHADIVSACCSELLLCEGAPGVRSGLASRFADNPKIRALAPEDLKQLPDASLGLIVLHSVAQYLTPDELTALLAQFHRLLAPGSSLVVSDIIPPHVPAATDAVALLKFGAGNGFFLAAVAGLARTLVSSYWRLRSQFGLTRYGELEARDLLTRAGFVSERSLHNIGHNQARMTFIARRR